VLPVLLTAIHSNEPQVLCGAAEGLGQWSTVPNDVIERLTTLVDAENEVLRAAAVLSLQEMRKHAGQAVPKLIARLGEETSVDIHRNIGGALIAIGAVAIPDLIDVIKQRDMRRLSTAALVLVNIGPLAVPSVVSLLTEADAFVRLTAISILANMGSDAACAVPGLVSLIDESTNDELIEAIVVAIGQIGPSAVNAAPAVVRCLIEGSDAMATVCRNTLCQLGPEARQILDATLPNATDLEKARIESTADAMRGTHNDEYNVFESLDADNLLAMFVHVGEFLEANGPTTWGDLAKELTDRKKRGKLEVFRFATSSSNLRDRLKELGEKLGDIRLTAHGRNKKGGLTEDGKSWLPRAAAYLAAKRRRLLTDE
jgi:hypothetical protein